MTTNIAHYNGSRTAGDGTNSGLYTIYTVPAGRTAKITFNFASISVGGGAGSGNFSAGGTTVLSGQASDDASFGGPVRITPSTTNTWPVPGECQRVGMWGGVPAVFTTTLFLGAGQTVSVTLNTPVGGVNVYSNWDFHVIENY